MIDPDPTQDLSRYSSLNASTEAETMPDPPSVSSKTRTTNAGDKYSVQPSTFSPTTISGGSTSYVSEEPTATMGYTHTTLPSQYEMTIQSRTLETTSHHHSTKFSGSSSAGGSSTRSSTVMTNNRHLLTGTPSPRTPKSVHFTDSPSPSQMNHQNNILAGSSPRVFQTRDWFNNSSNADEMSAITETPQSYPGAIAKSNFQATTSPTQTHTKTGLAKSDMVKQPPIRQAMKDTAALRSPEIRRPQPDTNPPSKPFSMFSCGNPDQVLQEPPTTTARTTPLGLACGLIQEEVSLLNKSQTNQQVVLSKSPRSPTQQNNNNNNILFEQPVHAYWLEQNRVRQDNRSLSNSTKNSLQESVSPPPTPPQMAPSIINLVDNPGPPSLGDPTQDYGAIFEYNPLRPSEQAVREMLDRVKMERKKKKAQRTAATTASASSRSEPPASTDFPTLFNNTLFPRPKLEPEEVVPTTQPEKQNSPVKSKKKKTYKPATPTKDQKKPTTATSKTDKSTQIENGPSPTKGNHSKPALVLTRKTHVDTNLLDNILPRPKSTTAARNTSKDQKETGGRPPTDLWNDAKRQRYEDLKGRVQPLLPPTMKISASMQVESSSTDGSFFSFSGVDEQENQATKNKSKENQTARSSPRLPPRYDVEHRSGFWGFGTTNRGGRESPGTNSQRDRIEESRDGRDDGEHESRETELTATMREPPESINIQTNQAELDRIESMRGSPTKQLVSQFYQVLGIPSLHSKPSQESKVNVKPRSMKNDFAENFFHQRQVNLGLPARSASAPRPRIPPIAASKQLLSTPENNQRSTPRKKSSPILSSPGTPKLDQRTVRLLYAHEFSDMVRAHSQHHVEKILSENVIEKISNPGVQTGLSFAIRKRPLLPDEEENGDFDVVEAPLAHPDAIVLYEASILSDRRTRDLKAHLFRFDAVFSDDISDDDFYFQLGQPYVLNAIGGGNGTFILVGGPRSGKSHIISEFEERTVLDVFTETTFGVPKVSVMCLDLYGNQCIDLLGPIGTFVRVVEVNGAFGVKGAVTSTVSNAQELLSMLENAKRRFTTQSTVRRRSDGRSYFICEIVIQNNSQPPGCITLVECPDGDDSEGKIMENTPFGNLMENIRAKVSGKATYPTCNLTKVLHAKLQGPHSETCVIGAVAPGSLDTEKTLSTLLSVKQVMKGASDILDGKQGANSIAMSRQQNIRSPIDKVVTMPRAWSKDTLLNWMAKKRLLVPGSLEVLAAASEEQLSGRAVMRMTKMQLKRAFYDTLDDGEKKAEKLFIALRAENDRVGRLRVKQRRAREKMGTGNTP